MGLRISLRFKIISLFLCSSLILSGVSLFLSIRQHSIMGEERNVAVRKANTIAMDGTIERHRQILEKAAVNLLNTNESVSFLINQNDPTSKMILEGMFLSFQEQGLSRLTLFSPTGKNLLEQTHKRAARRTGRPAFLEDIYTQAATDFNFHYYFRGIEGNSDPFPVEYCLATVISDDDDNIIGFAELALNANGWITGIAELTESSVILREAETGKFTFTTNTDLAQSLTQKDITNNGAHTFALFKNGQEWLLTDILPIADPDGNVVSHLLLSQNATASVLQARNNLIFILIVSGGIIALALFVVCFVLCRGVLGPIKQVTSFASDLASGHFVDSLQIKTKDEVADMGEALNTMAQKIRQRASEAEAISTGNLTVSIHAQSPDDVLGTSLRKIVDNLGEIIKNLRDDALLLQKSSEQVTNFSEQIKGSSKVIEDRTFSLTNVSGAIAADIENLASATEEMSSTVQEISENTERSKVVSEEAQRLSSRAEKTIHSLGESTKKIEAASEAISDFADQTNLLALNATIEAARAGEAGKGFAVVASEVKELANQSINTTKSIAHDVDDIQRHTLLVVEHTGEVSNSIAELDEFTLGVSAALTEQSVAANEIATTISGTSMQVKSFTTNLTDISDSISLNNEVIHSLTLSSHEMAELANRLNMAVDRFTVS